MYVDAWSQPGALTGGLNYYRAAAVGPPAGASAGAATVRRATRRQRPSALAQTPPLVVRVPTLVVWGEKDTALLPSNLDGLDRVVPSLTIKRIPDGTHWVVREKAPEVNRLIREFLSRSTDMASRSPRFSAATLRFLRCAEAQQPPRVVQRASRRLRRTRPPADDAVVEQLAQEFRTFAPEIVASPKMSMYRIYRDTRFSENKAPYKTHIAAVFPTRGLQKHEGAGLYFHVSADEVWIGGGMYSPQPAQLRPVREHIAANVRQLRAIVESPAFRRRVGSSRARG